GLRRDFGASRRCNRREGHGGVSYPADGDKPVRVEDRYRGRDRDQRRRQQRDLRRRPVHLRSKVTSRQRGAGGQRPPAPSAAPGQGSVMVTLQVYVPISNFVEV